MTHRPGARSFMRPPAYVTPNVLRALPLASLMCCGGRMVSTLAAYGCIFLRSRNSYTDVCYLWHPPSSHFGSHGLLDIPIETGAPCYSAHEVQC